MKQAAGMLYIIMLFRWISIFWFALALIGAPFGMGRMMDSAPSHAAMTHLDHMQGMDHGKMPSHEPASPHYMVCSACVAAPVVHLVPVRLAAMAEKPDFLAAKTLDGTRFLPPVPPPRA
jgi:hypothetical protein